ncbi:hypothetical protein FRC07_012194 [Ceratobasidium sp. 392]|nr:hypothetical protein FRC07_012194 [Ceratobasidium sp. 392]
MVLLEALQSRITRLSRRLDKFVKSSMLDDEEDGDKVEKKYLKISSDLCALVCEESVGQNPHLPELVAATQKVINKGIEYVYGESELFNFMPSWAHDANAGQPLVEDTSETKLPLPANAVRELLQILQLRAGPDLGKMTPDPWKDTMKKHPKSSPLARPRLNIPALTPTAANPVAMSVYDARCEITSEEISMPIKLCLSQGNSCLALSAASGWKDRSPAFYHYLLDKIDETTGFPNQYFEEPGLASVAPHIALDESRRLILVGDEDRVKSYAWAAPDGKSYKDGVLPTHTLDYSRANGPIAVLPNSTIVELDMVGLRLDETHGEDGEGTVGEENEDILEDTMRDDPEDI